MKRQTHRGRRDRVENTIDRRKKETETHREKASAVTEQQQGQVFFNFNWKTIPVKTRLLSDVDLKKKRRTEKNCEYFFVDHFNSASICPIKQFRQFVMMWISIILFCSIFSNNNSLQQNEDQLEVSLNLVLMYLCIDAVKNAFLVLEKSRKDQSVDVDFAKSKQN